MSEWVIRYKCRRCGGVTDGGISKEVNCQLAVMKAVATGQCTDFGIPVLLVGTHTCHDKAYGVTDLIGCEERK